MLRDVILRLRSLFRRDLVDRDLDDELRFHLEQQVDVYVRQGLSREDAQRRARLAFGGLEQIREEHRDARGIAVLSHAGRDIRHALRQFRRSPGFTALAVLCLGLAIGVNTSIFGVLNSVLLRPMPVTDPDRLIVMSRGGNANFSYLFYRDVRERAATLAGLAAALPSESDLDIEGDSRFVAAEAVSGNYARVIVIGVAIGELMVIVLGRALGSLNSDIQPPGSVVMVATGLMWLIVAVVATYVPAARAAGVNPLIALRYE